MLSPLNFRGGATQWSRYAFGYYVLLQTPFADMVVSQPQWVVTSVQC